MLWDGRTRIYITAPPTFVNRTRGLCGTFDYNQNNDFITLHNDIEPDVNTFGNGYSKYVNCQPEPPGGSTASPCETNAQNKDKAEQLCGYLKNGIFKRKLTNI